MVCIKLQKHNASDVFQDKLGVITLHYLRRTIIVSLINFRLELVEIENPLHSSTFT
jgi:hypothetical protein